MKCKFIYDRVIGILKRRYIDLNVTTIGLGSMYGGFNIYDDELKKKTNPVVYSFGVGEDISFDLKLIEKYNCEIYAFDPTPKSIDWIAKQNLSDKFHFYPYGISNRDGIEKFHLPTNPEYVSGSIFLSTGLKEDTITVQMKRLITIMQETGGGV